MNPLDLKTDIVLAAIVLILGAAIGGFAVHAWHIAHPITETRTLIQKVPVQVNVPAPPAKEVADVGKTPIPVKQVVAYKEEAKKQLHLPKEIQDAREEAVLSATTIEPSDHPETVTTVLDTATGDSRLFVQKEPLAWLASDKHGEISTDLVEKIGGPVVRIQVRQDLFQVKAVHFHVVAGGDVPVPIMGMAGKPDAYVGVGLHVGW